MQLFAYPFEEQSIDRLEKLAKKLSVESLRFWRHDDLHLSSRELIANGTSRLPQDYAVHCTLAGVRSDVMVMHQAKEGEIRKVMQYCRDWPVRPVFAVTTKQSVDMSLAVLFEHLIFDRSGEDRIRRQRLEAEKSKAS